MTRSPRACLNLGVVYLASSCLSIFDGHGIAFALQHDDASNAVSGKIPSMPSDTDGAAAAAALSAAATVSVEAAKAPPLPLPKASAVEDHAIDHQRSLQINGTLLEDSETFPGDPEAVTPEFSLTDAFPEEGCSKPAVMLTAKSKKNQPETGRVAANAIDRNGATLFSVRGLNRWLELDFSGGEGGDDLVEGVAIGMRVCIQNILFS